MTNPVITEGQDTNKQPRAIEEQVMDPIMITKQDSAEDEMYKQYEIELQQPQLPVLLWHKIAFVFLGIASLAGWNAILTAFDFFGVKYPKGEYLDVTFYFPIPIMICNFIAGLACPALAQRFSYNQRIAYSSIIVCIAMISVVIIAISYNNMAGYWISFGILFIQGFVESVVTNSLIALAGMAHPTINTIYWTSTAASGVVMNIIRLIALAALGDSPDSMNICTALYFSLAAVIYIGASGFQIFFTKSDFFKACERRVFLTTYKLQNRYPQSSNSDLEKINCDPQAMTNTNLSKSNIDSTSQKSSFQSLKNLALFKYLVKLSQVFKYAGFIPFYLVLIYIQTFMMFPGVSIFQKTTYTIIQYPWVGVYMIFIYNIGDLVGKYFGSIKSLVKLYFVYGVVWFRFVYYILFIMTARQKGGDAFQNDVFAWFNMFIFAVTNGFATSALMVLGPRKCKDPKIIDLINFIGGFSITFGISLGTFLALPLAQE